MVILIVEYVSLLETCWLYTLLMKRILRQSSTMDTGISTCSNVKIFVPEGIFIQLDKCKVEEMIERYMVDIRLMRCWIARCEMKG